MSRRAIRELWRERHGATAVEFALIAAPFTMLLVGAVDVGYQAYATAVVQGTTYAAARQATLEDATADATKTYVENRLRGIAKPANITVRQASFRQYSKIGQPEKLTTDVNGNGAYDQTGPDCFIDENSNNLFDTASPGKTGIGGAEDIVRFEVVATYRRLTPVSKMMGMSDPVTISRTTFMRNEPYAGIPDPPVRCGV